MLKGCANPLNSSKSARSDPTANEAFIEVGILFLSSLTQIVTLSCSLKTRPDLYQWSKN